MPFSNVVPLQEAEELTLLQTPELAAVMPVPWSIKAIGLRIPAGFPSPAADYTESELDLNEYLIPHKAATFLFTVVGDSMAPLIQDGDKVIADRSVTPKHNCIVIACVNQEYTIKRLYKWAGRIELRPENPKYKAIGFNEWDDLQVFSVITGVVRKFL